jgi:hypothetical protein
MVSVLLVAVVVWPASTGSNAQPVEGSGYRSPALIRDLQAEAAFIAAVGVGNRTHRPAERGGSVIVNYPDGIRPAGKEVSTRRIERPPVTAT